MSDVSEFNDSETVTQCLFGSHTVSFKPLSTRYTTRVKRAVHNDWSSTGGNLHAAIFIFYRFTFSKGPVFLLVYQAGGYESVMVVVMLQCLEKEKSSP